jgi:glutaredoxin
MQPEICVYGVDYCEDTQRTRHHLSARGIAYTYVNLDKDSDADRKVREWNHGRRLTPTVVVSGQGHTRRLVEPENSELDLVLQEHGLQPAA